MNEVQQVFKLIKPWIFHGSIIR